MVCNINRFDNADRPYCFTNEKNNSSNIKNRQMFSFLFNVFSFLLYFVNEMKCRFKLWR